MTELKSPEENPVHLSYNYNILPTAEAAPQRFINGCGGDMEEAKKRWTMTRRWREAQGVNGIINEPQPNFFIIKDCCPEYLCGHGKNGNIVFYERPGDFNVTMLTEKGINAESLLRHWLFITEYQWEVLNKDPLAKAITVLDIGSVCISALVGKTLEVVKQTIKWANQHYPERSDVILIINSPGWVSLLWKMVRPWIDKRTQNKVRIFPRSETLDGLKQYIDLEKIPSFYGGELKYNADPDGCRFLNPLVLSMNEYVRGINKGGTVSKDPANHRDCNTLSSLCVCSTHRPVM